MNTTKSDPVKVDLEQLLRDGNIIRIRPQGYSMYPLFIPGRDEALIQQADSTDCRRNDVVLYRRDQGILVLHRICRVTSDGFYMVGDNQFEVEGPLRPDQLRGRLIAFIHNGKEISVKNPVYRFLSSLSFKSKLSIDFIRHTQSTFNTMHLFSIIFGIGCHLLHFFL